MATQSANVSVQMTDADKSVKSFDVPINFDDATATLASLITWIQGLISALDPTVDVKLGKPRLCINIPLPGGIKAAANASSILERTALFTVAVTGSRNAYGIDVPGYLPSLFSGDTVPISGATATLMTYLETASGTIVVTDRYGNSISTLKSAKKTFRE